ncbi:MAG: B12-binding domain-containing radical SAM protein [Anaerolineales bacterium]
MRSLFLNPPYLPNFSRGQRSPQVTKSGTFYYPIWLAYAAGAVEADGHDLVLIDAPADRRSVEDVLAAAGQLDPGFIAVDTSTPSIENDAQVARQLKERCPKSVVALVGPHVSATPIETLQSYPWVDLVAVREYDDTLREVARLIAEGKDWTGAAGIALRRDGKPALNALRPSIQELDRLPFVSRTYRKHLDFKNYFYAITQWPVVTIISGRGCPYKCDFCLFPQTLQGHQYRQRSAENVVEELAFIEKSFPGVREVFIEDDTMTLNRKRMARTCDEIIRRRLKLHWTCNARCDVDLETLRHMHAANCRLLCVGIESGDQKILDNVEKGITLERIEQFFREVKRSGLLVHGCFMAGNDGETRETLQKTLDLAKRLNPDTAQFFPLMIYPGTRAYEKARVEDRIVARSYAEWLTPEGLHNTVVDRPDLPHAEIVAFCDRARREYYLRPRYLAYKLKQIFTHPREARRLFKSMKTFGRYLFAKAQP